MKVCKLLHDTVWQIKQGHGKKATQLAAFSTNIKPSAHLYQIPYTAHETGIWYPVLRMTG